MDCIRQGKYVSTKKRDEEEKKEGEEVEKA